MSVTELPTPAFTDEDIRDWAEDRDETITGPGVFWFQRKHLARALLAERSSHAWTIATFQDRVTALEAERDEWKRRFIECDEDTEEIEAIERYRDRIKNLEAENARLREKIRKVPHLTFSGAARQVIATDDPPCSRNEEERAYCASQGGRCAFEEN